MRRCYGVVIGSIVIGCVACSNEIDRRDELGIDDEGRSELVQLRSNIEGAKKSVEAPAVENEDRAIVVGEGAQPTAKQSASKTTPESIEMQKEDREDGQLIRYNSRGAFTVQVAGYRDKPKAQALVQLLREAGYPAYGIARPDGGEMRVRIGYFSNREEAEAFGRRFQADRQMEYWVDKRENE